MKVDDKLWQNEWIEIKLKTIKIDFLLCDKLDRNKCAVMKIGQFDKTPVC